MEEQHSSKRTKLADPEGFGLNTESPNRLLHDNTQLLVVSPDAATVWEKRRLLVGKFMFDVEKELDLVGELAERHSKNYLIWDYRRWVVEKLGSEAASKELEFTQKILSQGKRNYQAWSHRKWVIEKFDRSWLSELQYCHEILEKDIFNILAWDQICLAAVRLNSKATEEVVVNYKMDEVSRDKEANFAKDAIYAHPGNEGPWIYLKCLYVDDQKSLYTNPNLECIYVDILAREANRMQAALKLDPRYDMICALVDRRGCVHALHVLLDLIMLGYNVDSNRRLVNAVDVLSENFPGSVTMRMGSEVLKKVSELLLSLGARQIRCCNLYRGDTFFQILHLNYVNSRRECTADMQLDEDCYWA